MPLCVCVSVCVRGAGVKGGSEVQCARAKARAPSCACGVGVCVCACRYTCRVGAYVRVCVRAFVYVCMRESEMGIAALQQFVKVKRPPQPTTHLELLLDSGVHADVRSEAYADAIRPRRRSKVEPRISISSPSSSGQSGFGCPGEKIGVVPVVALRGVR